MSEFLIALIKGSVKALMILLAICSVLSVIMLFIELSDSTILFISVILIGLFCYLSAYFSTQIKRNKGLIQGIICGCITFIIIALLSIVLSRFSFSNMIIIKFSVCMLFGIIGGVKGINTKHTKVT